MAATTNPPMQAISSTKTTTITKMSLRSVVIGFWNSGINWKYFHFLDRVILGTRGEFDRLALEHCKYRPWY